MNKFDCDLDLDQIKNDFLSLDAIDNVNKRPIKRPSATSSHLIYYDYIDFHYLEANSKNINFNRDKEWRDSPHLVELLSLENELLFNPYLTYYEFKILNNSKKPSEFS